MATRKATPKTVGKKQATKPAMLQARQTQDKKRLWCMSVLVRRHRSRATGLLVENLNRWLRLRTTPIGMKLFTTVEDMEAIPRIRRPQSIHTTDQIVAMAARLGWTVGITVQDLVGRSAALSSGCIHRTPSGALGNAWRVCGMKPPDAAAHQQAMDVVPYGRYAAMAVSPLVAGRLNPPDVCLIYATPAQMILFTSTACNGAAMRNCSGAVSGNRRVPIPGGDPRHW